jgi:hypothetical protein
VIAGDRNAEVGDETMMTLHDVIGWVIQFIGWFARVRWSPILALRAENKRREHVRAREPSALTLPAFAVVSTTLQIQQAGRRSFNKFLYHRA